MLSDRVYAKRSPIHGRGCFAKKRIRKGELIGSYLGAVAQTDSRYVLWVHQGGDEWEGVLGQNELKYLNHSSKPNAEFDGVDLYAVRTIQPDEEITFHYGEEWSDVP